MGPYFKKDLLILWRDRKEMLISLIMPLILIIVLGSTLSSWIEKPNESLEMTIAIVVEDNEAAGLDQFRDSLASISLPEKSVVSLKVRVDQMRPIQLLRQMLAEQSFVTTIEMNNEKARQSLDDKEISAIITIPAGFTQATLNKMLLNKGSGAELTFTADQQASLRVDVLQDMLDGFVQSLNLRTAIGQVQNEETGSIAQVEEFASSVGGREKIAGVAMLTSFQYFSIAISIIFAMFVSSAMALKAITEKREHVFNRILLTGGRPFEYLAGKVGSSFCMSLLQLSVLVVLSHFIFNLFPGRSLQFWIGMALIILMFSMSVAALSALFTSLTFRVKDSAVNGLFTLVLGLLGTIGGSFVPVYVLPDWLKQVGEWTPNGLSLSVFIQWIGQDSLTILTMPFLKLIIFSIAMIGLGVWLFPRRGQI